MNLKYSKIESNIDYLNEVIERLDNAYYNRKDEHIVHGLFGTAMGALKSVKADLERITNS